MSEKEKVGNQIELQLEKYSRITAYKLKKVFLVSR